MDKIQRIAAGEAKGKGLRVRSGLGEAPRRSRVSGFSLLELMVVVAIVGILSAIAFPSYQSYVRKGNRSEAQQFMLEMSNREEQYVLDARAYTATLATGGLNVTRQDWTCVTTTCTNKFYSIAITLASGPPATYSITATATGTQAADGNLTYTSAGVKSRSLGDGKW